MYVHNVVDTAFVMEEIWSSAKFLQESSKVKESSLHETEMQILRFYLMGQILKNVS